MPWNIKELTRQLPNGLTPTQLHTFESDADSQEGFREDLQRLFDRLLSLGFFQTSKPLAVQSLPIYVSVVSQTVYVMFQNELGKKIVVQIGTSWFYEFSGALDELDALIIDILKIVISRFRHKLSYELEFIVNLEDKETAVCI